MLGNKGEEFLDAKRGICMNCFQDEFFKNQQCPKQKKWHIDIE
jgi:hypothetical protein